MKVKAAVAALALGCSVALGGCASSTVSQSPPQTATADVLTQAVSATEQAGTARITGSLTNSAAGKDMTAAVSGVQSFNPAAMDVTLTLDQGTVRQLIVDGKAYVQLPELGDKWTSIDLANVAGTVSPLMSGADLSNLPPVTADGTGTVEGAAVTFYKTGIDLDQALRLAGVAEDARKGLAGQLAADPGTATMRIAVDDAGRLVQFVMDTTVNLADGGTQHSVMDLRYYDFGVAADIKAPAPDQIVDGSALQGQLGGQ